jgi:hypothetical protein
MRILIFLFKFCEVRLRIFFAIPRSHSLTSWLMADREADDLYLLSMQITRTTSCDLFDAVVIKI